VDVALREMRRVPAGFHPRHAARYREYRYTVWNGPRSPLRERFALGVRDPLDIAAMERVGAVLLGRHDFSAFGVAHRQPVPDRALGPRPEGRIARDDRRRGPTPSSARWCEGSWPLSWRPVTAGQMKRQSQRRLRRGDRPSTGPRPLRKAFA